MQLDDEEQIVEVTTPYFSKGKRVEVEADVEDELH